MNPGVRTVLQTTVSLKYTLHFRPQRFAADSDHRPLGDDRLIVYREVEKFETGFFPRFPQHAASRVSRGQLFSQPKMPARRQGVPSMNDIKKVMAKNTFSPET